MILLQEGNTVTREERLKTYLEYKKLVDHYKQDDSNSPELVKEIQNYLNKNIVEVLAGYLYHRLERNIKGEMNRYGQLITFFVNKDDVIKNFSESSFLARTKEHIKETINECVKAIPSITSESVRKTKLFRSEILLDSYSQAKLDYLFYADPSDLGIVAGYKEIYKKYLLPDLSILYYKSNINRQINPDRFQIASEDNFREENALQEISLSNIGKLAKRLVDSVKEGRKLLSDDEIILSHQVLAVQDLIWLSISATRQSDNIITATKSSGIHESEEAVRRSVITILKGSMKQEDFIAFYTEDDYISFIYKKHPEIPKDRIQAIFRAATHPKPPAGVTRFIVPQTPQHKEIRYFITLEHIPVIFLKLGLEHKKLDFKANMQERHFVLFLNRLFKDFSTMKYTKEKVAGMLHCPTNMVDTIQKTVMKHMEQIKGI